MRREYIAENGAKVTESGNTDYVAADFNRWCRENGFKDAGTDHLLEFLSIKYRGWDFSEKYLTEIFNKSWEFKKQEPV